MSGDTVVTKEELIPAMQLVFQLPDEILFIS